MWRVRDELMSGQSEGMDLPRTPARRDRGLTLIEVLVALVQVGVLAAVVTAVVGGLTSSGDERACHASAAAARTGSLVFYAEHDRYPETLREMTAGDRPAISLPPEVVLDTDGTRALAKGWTMTIVPAAQSAPPTFSCVWFDPPASG